MSKNIYLNQKDKENDLKRLDENFNVKIFKDLYERYKDFTFFQGQSSFHNEFFSYYVAFYNPIYFRKKVRDGGKELNATLDNISNDYIELLKKIFEGINEELKKIDNSFNDEYWLAKKEVIFGDKEFKLMKNHMAIFSSLWEAEDFKKLLIIEPVNYQEKLFFELASYEKIPIGKLMFWYGFKSENPTRDEPNKIIEIIKILKLIREVNSIVGGKPNYDQYPEQIDKVVSKNGAVKLCKNEEGGIFYDIDLLAYKENLLDLFKGGSSTESHLKVPSKESFRNALQGNNEEGKDNQWISAAETFFAMINKNNDISAKKPTLNKLIPTDLEIFRKVKSQTKEEDATFELNEDTDKRYSYKQIGNFFFYTNPKKIEERTYYRKKIEILEKSEHNAIKSDDMDKDYLALPFLDNEDEKKLSYDNICKRTDIITNAIIEEIEKIIGKNVWRDA